MGSADDLLSQRFSVKRVVDGHSERVLDEVATEQPLQIRIGYWFKDVHANESLAVTMRTPGDDRELAAGFLLAEGVITSANEIDSIRLLGADPSFGAKPSNEIAVELARGIDFEAWRLARVSFANSSCGLCGKRSREAIAQHAPPLAENFRVDRSLIMKLPQLLRQHQEGFAKTGGLHAAALVDGTGRIEAAFEDIGRHNALDKLIGATLLRDRIPLADRLILLSSRSSFELVQKALMAGAPILATVGAPSSLAIEAAREHGLTLIGFIHDGQFNLYSGEWRIDS